MTTKIGLSTLSSSSLSRSNNHHNHNDDIIIQTDQQQQQLENSTKIITNNNVKRSNVNNVNNDDNENNNNNDGHLNLLINTKESSLLLSSSSLSFEEEQIKSLDNNNNENDDDDSNNNNENSNGYNNNRCIPLLILSTPSSSSSSSPTISSSSTTSNHHHNHHHRHHQKQHHHLIDNNINGDCINEKIPKIKFSSLKKSAKTNENKIEIVVNNDNIIIPTTKKVIETIDNNNIISSSHTITNNNNNNKILIDKNHHHHRQQQKEKIEKQQKIIIENGGVEESLQKEKIVSVNNKHIVTASSSAVAVENHHHSGHKTTTILTSFVAKKRKKEISTTSTSCLSWSSSAASIAAGQQSDIDNKNIIVVDDPEAKNIVETNFDNSVSSKITSSVSGKKSLKSNFKNIGRDNDIINMKDNNTKMDIMENVDLIANNSTYDCQQQMPNGDRDTADFNMTASMDDSMVDELTKNMANIGNEQISSDGKFISIISYKFVSLFLYILGGNNERSVTPSPANVQGLPYKELCEQLRHQLEYYFSYKNLSKDQYLVSQMDDEQYVAISIVANFDKIRRLTNDLDLVVQVLRDSTEVTVDETGTKVKPNSKRRVVILRDVPVEITRDTIIKIFEESKCPVKLEKCESTHNQSYYLYFHGDEDAQKAMTYLRDDLVYYPTTQIPILARIKAKPTVRHHTNQTNTNPVLGPNGKPNTVVLGAPMPVPPHNVISPIGIVTAPSPVGSTISSHSAAVSPVSSMSGSFINASNQQPNHSTTTVLLPTSATIPGGPPGTAESTLNAIPYPNAANVYPYNVPPLTRVSYQSIYFEFIF